MQQSVLADIVELIQIEESATARHLLCSKSEILSRSIRIFNAPLLVIRVEYSEQVFPYSRRVIALFAVKVEREFRVFALGELALVSVLPDLHELCRMAIHRKIPAEVFEQLHVDWK